MVGPGNPGRPGFPVEVWRAFIPDKEENTLFILQKYEPKKYLDGEQICMRTIKTSANEVSIQD